MVLYLEEWILQIYTLHFIWLERCFPSYIATFMNAYDLNLNIHWWLLGNFIKIYHLWKVNFNSECVLCNSRGKFAVVRKCIKKDSGKEFAAKFMRKRRKGQDCRTEIIHEIAVLELAQDDPWVIDLHEVYETPSEMILVLE